MKRPGGVLMGRGLSTSPPHTLAAMKANSQLGYIDRSIAYRLREGILHLYSLYHNGGVMYTIN